MNCDILFSNPMSGQCLLSMAFIYIYIYTSLHIKYRQKQKKKITQLPDTSILESTWEYEITKIDKYINKINKTIKQ